MSYSNELPLKLLSKCVNCDMNITNELDGFKVIKLNSQLATLVSTADEEKNLLPINHPNNDNNVAEIKIEVIDAISYMYGVSYHHLLCSYLKMNWKSLLPKVGQSSTNTTVAVDDSNVAVAMCSKCANLFERLYKVFRHFDKASSTNSILKGAIRSFRGERHISNEKFASEDPNSLQVKLEVTDRANDIEDECDLQTFHNTELTEDHNEDDIPSNFEEAEAEVKEEEDPLQGFDIDYMANCKVVLNRLNSETSNSENNDDSASPDEILVKRTRKNTYRVLPRNTTSLGAGILLKRRQQLKVKVNEAVLRLKKKNQPSFRNNINSSVDRFGAAVWCCGTRFLDKSEFSEHKNEQHNGRDSFLCKYCKKVVHIKRMSKHLFETHKIKFNQVNRSHFEESGCDKEEEGNENILDENLNGKNEEECGYTCQFCDTVMYFMDEFESHVTQHKQVDIRKFVFPYICCKVSFPDSEALNKHRKEKHNTSVLKVQCQFCKLFFSKQKLMPHLRSAHNCKRERTTYKCSKCNLVHGSIKGLTRHQKRKGHQMDVTCGFENCPKVFSTELSLREHRLRSHLGEFKYACKFCGKMFRSCGAKASHQLNHELEEQIVCDECGKAFKSKKSYKKHARYHQDVKLGKEYFKCGDCAKCFVDDRGLKKHIRIFHREDTKRIFTCEHCGKTTKNMTNMRIHQRIHDPNRIVKKKGKSPQTS